MAGRIRTAPHAHNDIYTSGDNRSVRLNSRNFETLTSGDAIGFQSKPALAVTSTGTIQGGQISPRVNSGFDVATIIGLHVDAFLRGTAARSMSGDVRALNLELVTDDAGVTAITGNVNAIRIRAAFSASVSGKVCRIRIEKMEAQTGSEQWDAVLELPSTVAGVWNSAPGTEPTTADGYIKVLVNGAARYIQLYSGAPVD